MMPAVHLIPDREIRPEYYRWGCSLAVVLLAHIAATAGFLRWDSYAPPPELLASAVTIELVTAPATPEPESVDTTPKPEQVREEPLPEPVSELQPQETPLPPPAPEEPERAMVFDRPPPVTAASPPESPIHTAAASMAGVSSPPDADPVRIWRSMLLAQLERHKRYPHQAQLRRQEGVPYLRFFLDHEGKVANYKLERSSGNASLDREALDLLQRAQPLPPPPAEITRDLVELVVPIEFTIR